MERNVALQNIAKRLKEENAALRKENASLRDELRKFRPEKSPETERKRWREDSSTPYPSRETIARKRIKTDGLTAPSPDSVPSSAMSLVPSPSSMVSSPESDSATSSVPNDPYSPMSFSARSPNPPGYPQQGQQPAMASLYTGYSGKVPGCVNENRGVHAFGYGMVDCGFCSDDTPCVCRELALQQVAARIAVHGEVPGSTPSIPNNTTSTTHVGSHSPREVKMESRGSISISSTPQLPPAAAPVALSSSGTSSILDNLPAYAPPVPLPRRRPSQQNPHASIFPIFPAQPRAEKPHRPTQSASPSCTGDPSNCLACADDPFGKAFCAALAGSAKDCATCPTNGAACHPGFGSGGAGSSNISGAPGSGPTSGASRSASISSASSPGHLSASETVPCNTAWTQLKSHPNIAFADLTLLAEVVTRRSRCAALTPGPDMEALVPQPSDGRTIDRGSDDMPILLTDPHAQYMQMTQHHSHASHGSSSSGSALHLQCGQQGQQRVVEVAAEGVRDALAMLDGQFQRN
jgi:AP-1-like transcription factor